MYKGLLVILALALAVPLVAQVSIDETPRRYMVIQYEGATREWEIRPIRITDRGGLNLSGASQGDFKVAVERWERTGLPKRYDVSLWEYAVDRYMGDNSPPGARFFFYAIDPRQPRADDEVRVIDERKRIYSVPAANVTVVGYPQTWVDVYEAYVTRQEGEARQEAVKRWEEAHRDIIENPENTDEGFTQEERNEFARFYQTQFVYIRDRNPKLAGIYDELAAFHRTRNNLDAELSTYLAALRAGVESPDRERFALSVGRIFVRRLQLHGEAIEYLNQARNHTEALYLLSLCHFEVEDFAAARTELEDLVTTLSRYLETPPAGDDPTVLELTVTEELGRANLLLAELEFELTDYDAMQAALARIPADDPSWDAGRVLYCAMLLQRNLPKRGDTKADVQLIRDIVKSLSFWNEALSYSQPQPGTVIPLNPLMARMLVIFAQTDDQYRQPRKDTNSTPDAEVLRYLTAAKTLDPLSAEPYFAEGRLYQRLGRFADAYTAYLAGLEVNPRHIMLNYVVADLNVKAGVLSLAKEHLERCITEAPRFYPAHVLLGEIAISDVERIREGLLIRRAAGEEVDYGGELVPPMKEAAAFFTSALNVLPNQPATELALATLYLRLSETAPLTIAERGKAEAVRRAYLVKARDMALSLITELETYADNERPRTVSDKDLAAIPSLACYNIYAFALYSLGDHSGALAAFEAHIEKSRDKRYIPDSQMRRAYEDSSAFAYAKEWVTRIERNQRQYFEIEEFDVDSTDGSWGYWIVPIKLKPDINFSNGTRIRNGKLWIDFKQRDADAISRIETKKAHATLSVFHAEIERVGDVFADRGIHITKGVKSATSAEPNPRYGILLGIDAENRIYWETREYDVDEEDDVDVRKGGGIIDVGDYGGVPLQPDDSIKLSLRRELTDDKSDVVYVAIINGYEVKLPVKLDGLTKVDFKQSRWELMCGFYTRAMASDTEVALTVDRVRFVYDSGLAGK